jgi:Predicted transcriptional regulator
MKVNNRLFEIVYILMQKRKVTAKELAERFEVSTRTIYRDIETISCANIPVYMTKGKEGGIGLLDGYVFNKAILSNEEQDQILFALSSLDKMNVQDEKDILDKMSLFFNKDVNDWIRIDFSSWGKDNKQKERFQLIKSAILNRQLIEISYYNSKSQKSQRIVEPLQIWFKDKSWYLMSYCRVKNDYRVFKITRIRKVKLLEEKFERRLPKENHREIKIETITLQLEIDKTMAYRVYDEFEDEEITLNQNGNFIINVEYPKNDWVYGYILSYGKYIKVISPVHIKDIMKKKLEEMLKNYL